MRPLPELSKHADRVEGIPRLEQVCPRGLPAPFHFRGLDVVAAFAHAPLYARDVDRVVSGAHVNRAIAIAPNLSLAHELRRELVQETAP